MLARCRKCITLWERWYIWILNVLQLLRSFEMIEKFPRGHENYSNSIYRCATGAVDIAFRSHFLLSWSSCELWTLEQIKSRKKTNRQPAGPSSSPHIMQITLILWFYVSSHHHWQYWVGVCSNTVSGWSEWQETADAKKDMYETWVSWREDKVSWLLRETSDQEEKKETDKKQHKLDVTKRWQAWRDFYITHVPAILWTG